MNFSQRQFKGMVQDITAEDISELSSPYCQDVVTTPRGSLSSPQGSRKWNTDGVGFINGFYDYRGRVGQYIMGLYSTTGAGYPGGSGYAGGGAVIPGAVVYTSTLQNNSFGSPPAVTRVFTSLTLELPATTYNGENFEITVTALDQFGSVLVSKNGTVSLTVISGSGTLSSSSMSMLSGVAYSNTMQYIYADDEASVTIRASISGKNGNDTMATKGYTIDLVIPSNTNNNNAFATTITAKTFNGNTYTNASGTVNLTEDGLGTITPTSLTMTNGVASGNVTYSHRKISETVTMTATLGSKTDYAVMSTTGYHWVVTVTGVAYNGAKAYSLTIPSKTIVMTVKDALNNTVTSPGFSLARWKHSADTAFSNQTLVAGVATVNDIYVRSTATGDETLTIQCNDAVIPLMDQGESSSFTSYLVYADVSGPANMNQTTPKTYYSITAEILTSMGRLTSWSESACQVRDGSGTVATVDIDDPGAVFSVSSGYGSSSLAYGGNGGTPSPNLAKWFVYTGSDPLQDASGVSVKETYVTYVS